MMRHALYVTVALAVLSAPAAAHAAGFALSHQGAASDGVAAAATARADLPETAWYNPAAIPPGFRASLGGSLVVPRLTHQGEGGETTSENPPSTPPWVHASWVQPLGRHRLGLALVGNVPYGSSVTWPSSWEGRFEATNVSLQVFEVAANAIYGVRITDDLELGAALQLRQMRGIFELQRRVDVVTDEATVDLGATASERAYGGSFFARFHDLSAGVHYRTGVDLRFDGDAHFEGVPIELSGAAHDQPFQTTLILADRLAIGAAYDLGFGTPSVDVEVMGWSRFETLTIDFEDEETPDAVQRRDYADTVTVRAGYEHRLVDGAVALRVGASYDPSPAPPSSVGPSLPDSDRLGAALGIGYRFPFGLGADLAYSSIHFVGVDSTNAESLPGRYDGSIHAISLGVSVRL